MLSVLVKIPIDCNGIPIKCVSWDNVDNKKSSKAKIEDFEEIEYDDDSFVPRIPEFIERKCNYIYDENSTLLIICCNSETIDYDLFDIINILLDCGITKTFSEYSIASFIE